MFIPAEQGSQEIVAQAEGWVMGDGVVIQPQDVQPGDQVHITAHFTNTATYLPAWATMQVKLDGLVIWEQSGLFPYGGDKESFNIDYDLPADMSSGAHRITAQEQGQQTKIPYVDFTITAPPQPGQRNVSFSSVPAGAQISVGDAYIGDTPVTVSLDPGTYAVSALYNGQTLSKNIQVSSGSGSMAVSFTFSQTAPFDLNKWLSDNKWYIGGALVGAGLLYVIIKKPDTVKRGLATASDLAGKGYVKAKEAYQRAVLTV